jgi:putative membrane protein
MTSARIQDSPSDRPFFIVNGLVSTAALCLLAYLLLLHHGMPGVAADLHQLPALNAALNGTSAALLLAGYLAIRGKRAKLHQTLMVGAFASSSLFLVSYLSYHAVHGDTHYVGPLRGLYLSVLASHILLSVPVVPLALTAFYFAWKKQFAKHRKATRWLFPIWMYVSVTGVVVFFMLRSSYHA